MAWTRSTPRRCRTAPGRAGAFRAVGVDRFLGTARFSSADRLGARLASVMASRGEGGELDHDSRRYQLRTRPKNSIWSASVPPRAVVHIENGRPVFIDDRMFTGLSCHPALQLGP